MSLGFLESARRVVCLGAHPDDIEIGLGGTLIRLADHDPGTQFQFVIATSSEERESEARLSATALLGDRVTVLVGSFEDGFLPYRDPAAVKDWLRSAVDEPPDLVFSPHLGDRHQDHRFLGELAWQLFRGSTILEYEIPKWEGDRPDCNVFVALDDVVVKRKVDHLMSHFASQHGRGWYTADLFAGVIRTRGMEAATTHAEGFLCRKLTWG